MNNRASILCVYLAYRYRVRGIVNRNEALTATTVSFLILISAGFHSVGGTSQGPVTYQAGARGDDSSIGNAGVEAEIRTNKYLQENPNTQRLDYFYVGSTLANGGFIQFGYAIEPGAYCLEGYWSQGNFTCTGRKEVIQNGDARWQWQYWPNLEGSDLYAEVGPAGSAGPNGTWHRYSIISTSNNWMLLLDGNQVASVNFKPSISKSPVYVVAEQVTTTSLARLGPVEFRALSYFTDNEWHQVSALYAIEWCGSNAPCSTANPYGVSLLGPNHIIAGSNIERKNDGQLLWSGGSTTRTTYTTTYTTILPTVAVYSLVGVIAASAVLLIFFFIRRLQRGQINSHS
jgi:hypothetical protein